MVTPSPPIAKPGSGDEERGPAASDLFRQEALEEYADGRGEGSVLRISPRWTAWTYPVLVAVFVAGLLFVIFGRISEYATGPALVRMAGHTELTARAAGTVEDVLIAPGERVAKGQVLVRFYAGAEQNEVDRVRSEFELQLIRLLRDPLDESARAAAAAIRPQLVLAEARLAERTVTAPQSGHVSDVRIRPGQLLAAGDPVLMLVQEDQDLELIAIVPGRYRPLLDAAMPVRFEVSGYAHAYLDLEISAVGEEVVGPSAVRRYLGGDVADAVRLTGPVVVVRAPLPGRTFHSDGRDHEFFPGMQGIAEIPVRRQSILVALVPGVRHVLGRRAG
jgi:membrane fusion protein (multidrug efflux system)